MNQVLGGVMGVFEPGLRPGDELTADDLRRTFQCQVGKGMRCSTKTNTLVLVVDHTKESGRSIYKDEWDEEGVLHYRGEGLRGDQDIERRANRWLRDAEREGIGVFLFEKKARRLFTYRGRVELAQEPYRRREPDIDGNPRWVWVFPLRLVGQSARSVEETEPAPPSPPNPEEARAVAHVPVVVSEEPVLDPVEPLRAPEPSHEEIQWRLLEMGALLGLDVWVAKNDRSKSFQGKAFADAPGLRECLPAHLAPVARSIIEHIDVLWLRGHRIEAAFEVEHSTSVYSGLLRLADLVAVQPNIRMDLYIVAPDARRQKVMSELTRPVFDALEPPLRTLCGYIACSRLLAELEVVRRYGGHLRPGFIRDRLAEFAPEVLRQSDSA